MRPQNTPPAEPFNDSTQPLSNAAPIKAAASPSVQVAPEDIKAQRLAGIGLTLLGLVMSYFTIYRPLDAAAHGVASLSVSMKLTAITPFLLLYGVTLLLFPKFVLLQLGGFRSRAPKTKIGWAYLIGLILVGFVFWLLMEARLRGYGYQF